MLLAGLIVSGGKRVEHKFYYDDNVTLIKDSIQIHFLEDELAGILDSSLLKQSLYIKTSLEKKYSFLPLRMKRVFNAERQRNKREKLENDNSAATPIVEPDDAFRLNLLIFKNATGKIIVNNHSFENLNYRELSIAHSKLFRYLQMLYDGVSLKDTFRIIDKSRIGDWYSDGLVLTLAEDLGRNYQSFTRSPYSDANAKKWCSFARKLNLSEEVIRFPDSYSKDNQKKTYFFLSTMDYLKTLAMIEFGKGVVEPSSILDVKNKSGNLVFERNLTPKKVFNNATMKSFKSLLSQANMINNNPIRMKEYKLIEDCFLRSLGIGYNLNEIYYVNNKYTIFLSARMSGKYDYYEYRLDLNPFKTKRLVYHILKELGHKQVPSKIEDFTGHWTGSGSKINKRPIL